MARMKTFLLYILGILGFMFLSFVLEDGLIYNMYKPMVAQSIQSPDGIEINNIDATATNMNGNMQFELTNDSNEVKNGYAKIDLYSEQGLLAATKYVPVENLEPASSKKYSVKFKGNDISNYKIEIVDELPDKTNIIDVLGWEVNLADVFGLDLTNVKIFGIKLGDIANSRLLNIDNVKNAAGNAWNWSASFAKTVPWWAYAVATGIVVWHLPAGFLFGII